MGRVCRVVWRKYLGSIHVRRDVFGHMWGVDERVQKPGFENGGVLLVRYSVDMRRCVRLQPRRWVGDYGKTKN